jgi:hypothetical protein
LLLLRDSDRGGHGQHRDESEDHAAEPQCMHDRPSSATTAR